MGHPHAADIHIHGLQDGCEDCLRHAQTLYNLDTDMLVTLHNRLKYGLPRRTEMEAEAMNNLDHMLIVVGRLGYQQQPRRIG